MYFFVHFYLFIYFKATISFLFNFFKGTFIYLFIYLFIYWLSWVFIAAHGLSLVEASRGYTSLRCMDFSSRWLLLLWSVGLGARASEVVACGLSSCGARA